MVITQNSKLLAELNTEQKQAVTFGPGPLLVVAGPGTGKTRVLTHRIAYLIEQKIARPDQILALTFTDKAAREMEERVDLLVPYGYIETAVSTFHAFGDRVLRDHGLELGISYRGVLTPAEQILFVTDHLFEFSLEHYRPLGSPTKHIQAMLKLVSRLKDEAISPEEYLDYASKLAKLAKSEDDKLAASKQLELARFYAKYQELLTVEGRVDYGDQVLLALKLFREHPDLLKKYQAEFPWILVDEFQDTNTAQFELLGLLAGKQGNITVVGDDDQAIYRFRGAALANILNFQKSYPKATQINLIRNYRSGQAILDVGYKMIQENNPDRLEVKTGVSKRLTATKTFKGKASVSSFATISNEADWVVTEIQKEMGSGILPGELAILVRTNAAAKPFMQSLSMRGIPYQFSGQEGLYERPEVRLLLSALRLIADPENNLALHHLAVSEVYRAPVTAVLALHNQANQTHKSLYELIGDEVVLKEFPAATWRMLLKVHDDLDKAIERSRDLEVGPLLYQFLQESGYLERLAAENSAENEIRVQNVARFFDRIRQFQEATDDRSAIHFVQHLEELMGAGEDPSVAVLPVNPEVVQILTVHAAKGLEFEKVFLSQMVQGTFPTRRQGDGLPLPEGILGGADSPENHLAEERRLAYVAVTRAKKELVFSWSEDVGGKRTRRPSEFIAEAMGEEFALKSKSSSPLERIERFRPAELPKLNRKIAADEPLVLSYRQIDDYRTCPRRYYLIHVLKLPMPVHHSLVYGRAIHAAISGLYRAKIAGNSLTAAKMVDAFRASWSNEGFLSRAHEEARLAAGEELVKKFHRMHSKDPAPMYVEKEFHFPVGIDRVVGRWDFVGQAGNIVDFKTGIVPDQKQADKRARESLQLGVYALAYQEIFEKLPESLALDFVESDLLGTTTRTAEQLEEVVGEIKRVAVGIRAGNYEPSPDHPKDCLCLKLFDS
jgi:DNA helicase-2/ATP-dependent DNA helicase PcrA